MVLNNVALGEASAPRFDHRDRLPSLGMQEQLLSLGDLAAGREMAISHYGGILETLLDFHCVGHFPGVWRDLVLTPLDRALGPGWALSVRVGFSWRVPKGCGVLLP